MHLEAIATDTQDPRVSLYHVHGKRGNRAYNRNLGAVQSKNEVIVFLDGDMVLSPGSIEAFRRAHENPEYVAFLGNAHAMRYSEIPLSLFLGHNDYYQMVQTDQGVQYIIDDPSIADWRAEPFSCHTLEPYFWIYYYTCICSVDRATFQGIGGFDEALVTWGSEDVDLGYMLSLCGKIGYVAGAHGLHVPHARNLWNEQLFDRDNLRYLLDKHRVWPFEFLIAFDLSAELYAFLQEMYDEIGTWDIPGVISSSAPDTVWVNLPTKQYRHDSVVWYGSDGEKTELGLLGVTLPCCDQRFKTAFVSTNIFAYPAIIAARILQECTRICQEVKLVPSGVGKRAWWEKEYLLQTREVYRTYYVSSDLMEYEFAYNKDGTIQVTAPEIKQWLQNSRSHCPIQISAKSRKAWHERWGGKVTEMILVNLLPYDTDDIRQKAENALGINIFQSYRFELDETHPIPLFDSLPDVLKCNRHSLLLTIPTDDSLSSVLMKNWQRPQTHPDFVLGKNGELRPLPTEDN